jgi:8-oxo-dGTP pyrophosphatase MutT (NUDIX family)
MAENRWKPSVTVAAIVWRIIDGTPRYLLIEEHTAEGLRLNNPAGHLDPGESPLQAVVRECLEETTCTFTPQALLGVYLSRFVRLAQGDHPAEDITYLRFAYTGTVGEPEPGRALDTGIVRTLWLTADELRASAARHRSPLILRCLDDLLAGVSHPLETLWADPSLQQPRQLGSAAPQPQQPG